MVNYGPNFYLCHGEFWKKNIDNINFSKKIINIGFNLNYIRKYKKKNTEILFLSEIIEFYKIKEIILKLNKYSKKKYIFRIT